MGETNCTKVILIKIVIKYVDIFPALCRNPPLGCRKYPYLSNGRKERNLKVDNFG